MTFHRILAVLLMSACGSQLLAQSPADQLARVLRDKGLLTESEFERITASGSSDKVQDLAAMLRAKGLISESDLARLEPKTQPEPKTPPVSVAAPAPKSDGQDNGNRAPNIKLYGTLLFNAFSNDTHSNNEDIPSFALPRSAGPVDNFGATARQARLGLSLSGLNAAGAKLSGTLETDFFGGAPTLSNGVNMDVIRMRLAFGRLDWTHFAVEAGQDWAVFAPLNPTSLAEFAIPEFSSSGNLWIRTPQIRAEWKSGLSHDRGFLWQLAALDPNIGDNPDVFSTARQPGAGELGRLPAVETRLALSGHVAGRAATLGLSGHWGTAKNSSVSSGVALTRSFESWGAAVDYNIPLSSFMALSGEAYAGRALGLFSGGIAQTVFPVHEPGDNGVGTRGGWLQLQFDLTGHWQTNVAYGIDLPEKANLSTGSRSKNQSYMANILWHVSPNVTLGLDWRRFLTDYFNQPFADNSGDHFNLAAAYTF